MQPFRAAYGLKQTSKRARYEYAFALMNSVSAYRFIDPHVLAAISDLHLLAKTVIDGFMFGANQSPLSGAGLEFNQYRSYQPGDDLRRVDWKMYARSDRHYVREAEVETSITVRFLLDASASMAHTEDGIRKFDYARFLIAALGYLAHQHGDAIGLEALSDVSTVQLGPKREPQQLHRFLHELEHIEPCGAWPQQQHWRRLLETVQRRELLVVVSDLHEYDLEITTALTKLRALKNEVILFQLLGRNEAEFRHEGALTFEDLETGETVEVEAATARRSYLSAVQSRLLQINHDLHEQDIAYELFFLDQPLDFALRRYLTQRMKML